MPPPCTLQLNTAGRGGRCRRKDKGEVSGIANHLSVPPGARLFCASQANPPEHILDARDNSGRGIPLHVGCQFPIAETVVIAYLHWLIEYRTRF